MRSTVPFEKYEGLGNDFIVVEATTDAFVSAARARELCDRRRGVGADGVLLLLPATSPGADARMRIRNPDGSIPEMCGNGLRCAALHVARARGVSRAELLLDTDAGPRRCAVDRDGDAAMVLCDMGMVRVDADVLLDVGGERLAFTRADAGNPHAVVFREISADDLCRFGPGLSTAPVFEHGANVEFAHWEGSTLAVRVWERGAGATLACGTGACAAVAVAYAKGLARGDGAVRVRLPGGELEVRHDPGDPQHVDARPGAKGLFGQSRGAVTLAAEGLPDATLRILVASQEGADLETVSRALLHGGDLVFPSRDMAESIASAAAERIDVAFVDVMLDGGAGMALVHHLSAATPRIVVYALAPESNLELGAQAVALGASGFVSLPPAGDAVLHAVGEVRARRAAESQKIQLEAELAAARRRNGLMDRVVQLAHGGAQSEVARAILEALAEVGAARSAALYGPSDPPQGECVRLAALGSSQDLPATVAREELLRVASARGAMVVPLAIAERVLAMAILEGGDPSCEREVVALGSLAATVLAFLDAGDSKGREGSRDGRARVYSFGYLQDIASREIDKAKRHGRRLAVAGIILDKDAVTKARSEIEPIVLSVVRDTDVLARFDEREYYLLLPETDALGAHACRRRLLIRAEGDRRARTPASDRRGPVSMRPGRGIPVSIGVAAYPHDGVSLDRLLRAARQRASDSSRSAVHSLALAPMPLADIIDALLARPMVGGGFGAPSPLDLVAPAMLSLVGAACREAKRGGAATVLVTARGGMGMASAARQVFEGQDPSVQIADVRSAPRCDNAEAIVVNAEHGAWVCCGRRDEDRFRGVHASDPLLADLVAQRLSQASGARWP